jgi:hypothetical protein
VLSWQGGIKRDRDIDIDRFNGSSTDLNWIKLDWIGLDWIVLDSMMVASWQRSENYWHSSDLASLYQLRSFRAAVQCSNSVFSVLPLFLCG